MSLDLYNVHKLEKEKGTNRAVIAKKRPYTRFTSHVLDKDNKKITEDRPPVICQSGRFYSDGGKLIKRKDVPEWAWEKARLMSPKGRDSIGLKLPEELEQGKIDPTASNGFKTLGEAIDQLDPDEDSHWSKAGLPEVKSIGRILGGGNYPTRDMVEQARPGLVRPGYEKPGDGD